MSSFVKRTITGIVLFAILFFFLFFLRPICIHSVDILILVFLVVGMYEMYRATVTAGHKTMKLPIILFAILIYPLFFLYQFNTVDGQFVYVGESDKGLLVALIISCVFALGALTFGVEKIEKVDENGEKVVEKQHKYNLSDLGATLLVIIYPGVFTSMFFAVNLHGGDLIAIMICLLVPLFDDMFAYFVGSKFGKHKLCPSISPKKTVEGLIGGIVGAFVAQTGIFLLFDGFKVFNGIKNIMIPYISDKLYISIPIYFILTVLIIIAEFAGDLVASRVKRLAGIKDYGKILPGHGGVMDRLDSLIFSLPIVYIFFTVCRICGVPY